MPTPDNGLVHRVSNNSASRVLERLLTVLSERSIKVFAVVDHSGEAAKAGFEMHDTKLVVFGNPKAGTPLMLAAPDSAIDLPLKILVAESSDGMTKVSYNSPRYFTQRFGLSPDTASSIAVIEQIVASIVE